MRRHAALLVVLGLLALALGLFVAFDPLELLGAVERATDETSAPEAIGGRPTLSGLPSDGTDGEPATVNGEPVGVLDLKMGSASLTGLVTGSGAPLAHARVRVAVPVPEPPAVRTRRDGTWEVRGLPAGRFDVRAWAPSRRSRTVLAPPLLEGQSATVEPIDLGFVPPLDDGIEVRVWDETGRPIPGAKVLATTMMWGLHMAMGPEMSGVPGVVSRTGATDEQGIALLTDLPPNRYDVVAIAPGFVTTSQPGVVLARGRVERVFFRLAPGATISGTVVDAEDRPVAEAYVAGLHQPTFAGAVTVRSGADGSFLLDGLRTGRYMVIAGHEEHGEATVNPVPSPGQGVRVRLAGAGSIEGTVTDPEGKPVPRFRVRPYRESWFSYTYSFSTPFDDPEGRFRFSLPPGTWILVVQGEDGSVSSATSATVTVGKTTAVKVTLAETGIVRGVVTDPEGNHLSGAEVFVRRGGFPPEPDREQYSRTDDDGRFAVKGLPLLKTRLRVRHGRYAETTLEATATLEDEAPEVTVRLAAGGRIDGQVFAADGRGIGGVQVNAYSGGDFFDARTTRTDDDGAYAFDALAAGVYTVTTGAFEQGAGGMAQEGVQVPAEGSVRVDFRARPEAGTVVLAGMLRRGSVGVADATLAVTHGSDRRSVTLRTDGAGGFRAEGIAAGTVRIYAQSPDGASRSMRIEVPATGLATPLVIDLGGAGVRGLVVSPEDAPVSGAWVQVDRTGESGDPEGGGSWSTTRQDGTFRVEGLDPGTYQVRVTREGAAPLVTPPISLGADETKDLGRLALASGAALSGRVTDDEGTPVEDATISLDDSSGRPVFSFSISTTGSDGRYRVPELRPGRYTVRFEARGYGPATMPVTLGPEGATLDATLSRGGEIRAVVEDAEGNRVPGAQVTLFDARGKAVTRTLSLANLGDGGLGETDASGTTVLPDLAPGSYRVSAKKSGLAPESEPVVAVAAGRRTEARLVLRPAGD